MPSDKGVHMTYADCVDMSYSYAESIDDMICCMLKVMR